MGNSSSTSAEGLALVHSKFSRPECHFRTFLTSRNTNFIDYECHMVALSCEDYCRWDDIVFNHNKARYPGGVIPNASPRRHGPIELDADDDLDFFEDGNALFETHPIHEAWRYSDCKHREDLDFGDRPVLVLMTDREWKAWSSSYSVGAIDAHDSMNVSEEGGAEYSERLWWDCELRPAETCNFCNCVSCRNPNGEDILGHCDHHYTKKAKSD